MFSTHCWTDPFPQQNEGKAWREMALLMDCLQRDNAVPDCMFPYYNPDTGSLLIHGHRCPICIANIITPPPSSPLSPSGIQPISSATSGHQLELGYWACSQCNWCKLSPALSCERWNWDYFLCSALITQGQIHWDICWVALILKKPSYCNLISCLTPVVPLSTAKARQELTELSDQFCLENLLVY